MQEAGSGYGAFLALLLLSSSGHCRPSLEDEVQGAPLSQLRAQVTGVEELLEEFRQQLQQQRQGDPRSPEDSQDPRRLQGEHASLGDVSELARQQGGPMRIVASQGVHKLRGEELGPGEDNGEYHAQGEGQITEDIMEAHHKMGSLNMDHAGDLQRAGDEQGLHTLQQLQNQGRKQQEEVGCEGRFTTLQDYIIRTKDSLAAGATFLMAPGGVSSWHQCLGTCCQEPSCSVAVVELSDAPSHQSASSLSCYLFDCTYRGHNVCTFSLHRGYNSFTSSRVNASVHQQREPTSSYQRNQALTAEQQESDEPPRSNAGQDVVLQLPKDWVVLDGRESIDDHGIIRYEWNLLHGDPSLDMKECLEDVKLATFALMDSQAHGADSSAWGVHIVLNMRCQEPQPGTIQLSHLQEGAYAFQLTVTDTAGQRSSDNITVTVLPMERRVDGCTGSCTRYQFTCDDGCCIDITLACDRVVQCPDGSDEAFCQNFGPDRKAVTHAENNNPQNTNMELHKIPEEGLEMKYDQRNHAEKQPLDPHRAQPAVAQEVQKSSDRFIPEHCIAPPVIGPCKGLFSRWYFDVSSTTCMQFFYGGCKGNENNFLQEADCIAECADAHGVIAKEFPTKAPEHTNALPEFGSSGTDDKPKDDYGEIMSKGKVGGVRHPAPETGAVLPLALGLAITALLLLMVVCRLRLVRQKLKKARPLTSEESDYLINGMYL